MAMTLSWQKLGRIFNPTEHHLPHNCKFFSQSPQTLVLPDRVRVYFSTRELDSQNKYLSHISFVDYSLDMSTLLSVSDHTVIPLGHLGSFDEHGIFPINICKDGDRILAYTTGWNRKVSVSADASIGLAYSYDNGFTFQKYGTGPVLTSSLNEPFLVADAFVTKISHLFHMWYIYGVKWQVFSPDSPPDRVYKIAHATSTDGLEWSRDGIQIIPDVLNEDECQALPTVLRFNGLYHMFFCYREAYGFRTDKSRGYRIGYAYSYDLLNWIRDDHKSGISLSSSGWDSEMQCYPHIFTTNKEIFLIYNGNKFGREGFGLAKLNMPSSI